MSRITLTGYTYFYVDILNGSDMFGDGLTKLTAWRTPQHARDTVFSKYDCNLFGVKFIYCNVGISYPGVIAAYPLLGLPHDYGEMYEGELDANGSVAVLVDDNSAGCFHAASGAQPYIKNFGMKSSNGACCVTSAYGSNTLVSIDHCVFYGSVDRSIIEAGPSGGRISIDSECWCIWNGNSTDFMAEALLHATDGGVLVKQANGKITFQGANAPKFHTGTVAIDNDGRMHLNGPWGGTARGKRWYRAAGGKLLVNGLNPDTYIPGDQNGVAADSTGFTL